MTPEEHAAFCGNVVNTTNLCCIATLWIAPPLPSVPGFLAIAVMLFTIWYQLMRFRQAKQRYDQAMKEHLEAGGAVMIVKRGRRWLPVPILPPRDVP